MLIAATSLGTLECRVEACGGRWSSRSRLRAADPLHTVQGPSAGSRAPLVGAIGGTWDVVTLHAKYVTHVITSGPRYA